MATVHVVLGKVSSDASRVGIIPLSEPVGVDTVSSSGTSQQSSLVATALPGQFWDVTAGGDVYVKFGANPTAVTDEGWLIKSGQTRQFAVGSTGEKIAIKDA